MGINLNEMSKLGFGLMRLPEKDGVIDIDHVCRMVDRYMKAGMNYSIFFIPSKTAAIMIPMSNMTALTGD